jgi:hypothetical protein
MPYITCVAGTVITASWANANIRDQVVTPVATASARSALIPAMVEGQCTYLEDLNVVEVWNGTACVPVGGGVPVCFLQRTAAFALTFGSTLAIPYDTEIEDPWGLHSLLSDTERITPNRPGYYAVSATVEIDNGATSAGFHSLVISKNGIGGTEFKVGSQIAPINGVPTRLSGATMPVYFNGTTDYVVAGALNAAGAGTLNCTSLFAAWWVGC